VTIGLRAGALLVPIRLLVVSSQLSVLSGLYGQPRTDN
jgi:hypothetical protein